MTELLVPEVQEIVKALHERLGTVVQAAYLYGSIAHGCISARDLDVLLVVPSTNQVEVFSTIANVQHRHRILIHPTVVCPRELHTNPFLQELVSSAIILWRTVCCCNHLESS